MNLYLTCTSPKIDATLYRHLVGSLLYLTHYHPNISFVFGLVSWYMKHPQESHWKTSKIILRYNRGIVQFEINYNIGGAQVLVGS